MLSIPPPSTCVCPCSLGSLPPNQVGGQTPYLAGFARQYPYLYSSLRRQTARCQCPRPTDTRTRRLLRHGPGLPGFPTPVSPEHRRRFLRYPRQVQHPLPTPIAPPATRNHCDASNTATHRPTRRSSFSLTTLPLPHRPSPNYIAIDGRSNCSSNGLNNTCVLSRSSTPQRTPLKPKSGLQSPSMSWWPSSKNVSISPQTSTQCYRF